MGDNNNQEQITINTSVANQEPIQATITPVIEAKAVETLINDSGANKEVLNETLPEVVVGESPDSTGLQNEPKNLGVKKFRKLAKPRKKKKASKPSKSKVEKVNKVIELQKVAPPPVKRPGVGGRPTNMTDDVMRKLEMAFKVGATDAEACAAADIHVDVLYRWQVANPEFHKTKLLWKQMPIMISKSKIVNAINNGDLATAKWYLERRAKHEFSPDPTIIAQIENNTLNLDASSQTNNNVLMPNFAEGLPADSAAQILRILSDSATKKAMDNANLGHLLEENTNGRNESGSGDADDTIEILPGANGFTGGGTDPNEVA